MKKHITTILTVLSLPAIIIDMLVCVIIGIIMPGRLNPNLDKIRITINKHTDDTWVKVSFLTEMVICWIIILAIIL